MAKLLFSLRGVPEDEAEEVRAILDQHGFDYYETSAGNWGISLPALWLANDEDDTAARQLLEDYQRKRFLEQRAIYEQLKREGREKRLLDGFRDNPVQFLLYVGFIALIVYVSIRLLFEIGL